MEEETLKLKHELQKTGRISMTRNVCFSLVHVLKVHHKLGPDLIRKSCECKKYTLLEMLISQR